MLVPKVVLYTGSTVVQSYQVSQITYEVISSMEPCKSDYTLLESF